VNQKYSSITQSQSVRIGYFAQDFSNLNEEKSLIDNVLATSEQSIYFIHRFLISLGFDFTKMNTKVRNLSGGERVKTQLAQVLLANSNLLLLDEPTNYLDIAGKDAFIKFLNTYNGSLIIITHDLDVLKEIQGLERYFIESKKLVKYKQILGVLLIFFTEPHK